MTAMSDQKEETAVPVVEAINWNKIEDQIDITIWNRYTENFWLPEKIPLSNDKASWATFNTIEKLTTSRVLGGLTLLDTMQTNYGATSLMTDSVTPHEESNYAFQAAMEAIHAKSYSSIFSTLCSTEEIEDIFRWTRENPYIKRKQELIMAHYVGDTPLKRKIASVFLESFLFYSGFYLPLYWDTRQKLTNTANIIKLILRDEAAHGFYIGYKFKLGYDKASAEEQAELKQFAYDFLMELYENEVKYTQSLYDELGLTEDVKRMLHYNANKALMNLGFDPLFPESICNVNPSILAALVPEGNVSHDFFSLQGNTYKMMKVETTTDDDWNF